MFMRVGSIRGVLGWSGRVRGGFWWRRGFVGLFCRLGGEGEGGMVVGEKGKGKRGGGVGEGFDGRDGSVETLRDGAAGGGVVDGEGMGQRSSKRARLA